MSEREASDDECPICGPTMVQDGTCLRHGDVDELWGAYAAGRAAGLADAAKACLLEQVGHSTPAISDDEAYNTACIHCSEAILLLDVPEGK